MVLRIAGEAGQSSLVQSGGEDFRDNPSDEEY
jgi:hypothetical protein